MHIEQFITVLAILIIFHKLCSWFYLKLGKKFYRLVQKDMLKTRTLFRDNKLPTRYALLSALWLIVRYYENIF